jgi:hypothetical protein
MNGKFQIRIPSPCQENWDAMRPEEKGRHCASCQKTVVDFTGMSDGEIIRHLARAGQSVCGRMAPEQLNKDLSLLPPPHMNGVRGWPWVLAGALLAGETSVPERAVKADVIEQSGFSATPVEPRMGGVTPVVDVPDTVSVPVTVKGEIAMEVPRLMGDTVLVCSDALKPVKPTCKELTVKDSASEGAVDGGILMVAVSDIQRQTVVDTVRQWVADSLTAIGLLPERGLSVYPNPVRRGNVVSLSWKAEAGAYQVGLFNISGGLVQEREIVVSAKGQVNLLEIPAGVGAGVYVIRAVGVGGRSMTRELVIQ